MAPRDQAVDSPKTDLNCLGHAMLGQNCVFGQQSSSLLMCNDTHFGLAGRAGNVTNDLQVPWLIPTCQTLEGSSSRPQILSTEFKEK